jgi:hypothetical protein
MKTAMLLLAMIPTFFLLSACSAGTNQLPIRSPEDQLTLVFFYTDN